MSFKGKNKSRPGYVPVQKIELSEKNVKLRSILVVVLLAIGAVALMVGLFSLLNTEPGWQEIEASSSNPNCSADFQLSYDFTDAGSSATAQSKQITSLYTQATEDAYRIFSPDVLEEGLYNLGYLNAHVNETVTVEEALYQALELIAGYQNRSVFLAPVYEEYERIFLCESDVDAARYDPAKEPELLDYIQEAAAFADDPQMIRLELLGENQVRLYVDEAYLAFIEEYEIDTLVDFSWMTNAFIADYIADILIDNGYTSGYLASYDGFTRNLDSRGQAYSSNIFDRVGSEAYRPAVMTYDEPMSIVALRNYPMSDRDRWHYYGYEDGSIATILIDPADGLSKSAINDLVCYSGEAGCAEILLQMIPIYVTGEFDAAVLNALTADGVYAVWCEDQKVCYNDPDLTLEIAADSGGLVYTKTYAG